MFTTTIEGTQRKARKYIVSAVIATAAAATFVGGMQSASASTVKDVGTARCWLTPQAPYIHTGVAGSRSVYGHSLGHCQGVNSATLWSRLAVWNGSAWALVGSGGNAGLHSPYQDTDVLGVIDCISGTHYYETYAQVNLTDNNGNHYTVGQAGSYRQLSC